MSAPTQGTIDVAKKLAELIERAPAGGIFHDAVVDPVSGFEVEGFGGFAGFSVRNSNIDELGAVYEIAVQRVR